jgi:uracil-DNA glycosylase family protein
MRHKSGPERSGREGSAGLADLEACRRCDLWKRATQAVPGEGPPGCALMLVGEQPGDQEDRAGRPFVGPAGQLLDELLQSAGLERDKVFVTNAVKHFKWEARGKRRLHARPAAGEVGACNIWLTTEIATERPQVIVALGATAVRALLNSTQAIAALRAHPIAHPSGAKVIVTYHPSAVLRAQERAESLRKAIVEDLRLARHELSAALGSSLHGG